MCSKHEKLFFTQPSENIQTWELRKISKLQKISEKIFLFEFVFSKNFLLTKMFFSDNFFQRIFHYFQDHYTVLK